MANPDQKTILLERAYDELKSVCSEFQEESGATDMEVKTLLRELSRVWEKDIDDDDDILFGAPEGSDFYVNGMGGVLICSDGKMHEKQTRLAGVVE